MRTEEPHIRALCVPGNIVWVRRTAEDPPALVYGGPSSQDPDRGAAGLVKTWGGADNMLIFPTPDLKATEEATQLLLRGIGRQTCFLVIYKGKDLSNVDLTLPNIVGSTERGTAAKMEVIGENHCVVRTQSENTTVVREDGVEFQRLWEFPRGLPKKARTPSMYPGFSSKFRVTQLC